MRLQGSQTRLGGDISRVKRESAGDGRKRKSVGKQAVAKKGVDVHSAAASVQLWSRWRRRETSDTKFNSLAGAGGGPLTLRGESSRDGARSRGCRVLCYRGDCYGWMAGYYSTTVHWATTALLSGGIGLLLWGWVVETLHLTKVLLYLLRIQTVHLPGTSVPLLHGEQRSLLLFCARRTACSYFFRARCFAVLGAFALPRSSSSSSSAGLILPACSEHFPRALEALSFALCLCLSLCRNSAGPVARAHMTWLLPESRIACPRPASSISSHRPACLPHTSCRSPSPSQRSQSAVPALAPAADSSGHALEGA